MKGKDWLSRALSHPAVSSGATSVLGIWVFPSPQKLQGERDRSQDFQIVALLPVVFLLLGNDEGETGSQMCRATAWNAVRPLPCSAVSDLDVHTSHLGFKTSEGRAGIK